MLSQHIVKFDYHQNVCCQITFDLFKNLNKLQIIETLSYFSVSMFFNIYIYNFSKSMTTQIKTQQNTTEWHVFTKKL